MNAVNPASSSPVSSSPVAPDGGVAEPSMEEILASIRRIIADDASAPRQPPAPEAEAGHTLLPPPHEAPLQEAADVSSMDAPPMHDAPLPEPEVAHPIEATAAPLHEETSDAHGIAAPLPGEDAMNEATTGFPPHPLAPQHVAGHDSVDLTPEPLLEPVPEPASPLHHDSAPHVGAAPIPPAAEGLVSASAESAVTAAFNTLAASRFVDSSEQLTGLVREMIRPLVKAWVDEHLPGMVERLVVAEIERMARR